MASNGPPPRPSLRSSRRVTFASLVGTAAALVFNEIFFPSVTR